MKYALVTGGSRGIGRAVCLKLAEMGYHILINYQSNDTEAEATLQQKRDKPLPAAMADTTMFFFPIRNWTS